MFTINSKKGFNTVFLIGIIITILAIPFTISNIISTYNLKANTPASELSEESQKIISKELKTKISASLLSKDLIEYFKKDEPRMNFISAHQINIKETTEVKKNPKSDVKKGYITAYVLNVREKPTTKSRIVGNYRRNDKVDYMKYNNNWYIVEYDDALCFISSAYITDKKIKDNVVSTENKVKATSTKDVKMEGLIDTELKDGNGIIKYAPRDNRKSYMDFRTITSRNSPQYKLQYGYATTASNGVRTVNGRYCIALGSYFTHEVGRYVDLYLANGTVIPCIIGDCKQDIHTTHNHAIGIDGGVSEFIVHTASLPRRARQMGDVSYADENWNSPVVKIKVYKTNVFKK